MERERSSRMPKRKPDAALEELSSSHGDGLDNESDSKSVSSDNNDEVSRDIDEACSEYEGSRKRSKASRAADKKRCRGNYRCSKCGQPKKGHVCPYQPRYKKRDPDQELPQTVDRETQAEIDPDMTVRQLPLHRQGFPESYMPPQTQSQQSAHNFQVLCPLVPGPQGAPILTDPTTGKAALSMAAPHILHGVHDSHMALLAHSSDPHAMLAATSQPGPMMDN